MNMVYVYIENDRLIVEVTCPIGKRILGSFHYPLRMEDVLCILTIYNVCRELFPNIIINYSIEVAMSNDSIIHYIMDNAVVYPMQEICA